MFHYSLDVKDSVTDKKGNVIRDLASSIFTRFSRSLKTYDVKSVTSNFNMRPDLVSVGEYGTDDNTEMILKFSGISNPFSFCKDDLVVIPAMSEAKTMMVADNPERTTSDSNKENSEVLLKNFFKFHNPNGYKKDYSSYDKITKMNIPSGAINENEGEEYSVPYISEDGEQSVRIANGKVYFGANSGVMSADQVNDITSTDMLNNKIQSIINNTKSALADSNCLYNGTQLSSLVKSTYKKNNSES